MSDAASSTPKVRRRPRRAKPIRSRKAHFNAVVNGEEHRFQWDPQRGVVVVRRKHAREMRVLSAVRMIEMAEPVGRMGADDQPPPHPELFNEGLLALKRGGECAGGQ